MVAVYFVLVMALMASSQASASPFKIVKEWKVFKEQFNKTFHSLASEARHRFNLEAVLDKINKHNERHRLGLTSYSMKPYEFSDQAMAEFASTHGGVTLPANHSQTITRHKNIHTRPTNRAVLPKNVDWRRLGIVTAVRNQYPCNSCWAFSVAGTIEAQVSRKSGKPAARLSPQHLMDCINGPKGCSDGEWPVTAFEWIRDHGGIDSEMTYPYMRTEDTCRFNKDKGSKAKIKSWVEIDSGDEQALVDAIANVGPVSVTVQVKENFVNYADGVYYDSDCSKDMKFRHAMLAVGYGSENGHDYYIIKNSWGQKWGEDGYIRMSRNRNNNCEIATYASYPQIA